MPGDVPSHPDKLLKGLRHTRRFEDKPVPLAVMDALLTAGRAAGDVRLMVIDDLVTMQELTRLGSLARSMAGAAAIIVVLRPGPASPDDASIGRVVVDAVMLAAQQHGLGAGNGWFGTDAAQAQAREVLGLDISTRILVAIGVGYVNDDPAPSGSSLSRAQATLDMLSSSGDQLPEPQTE